MSRQVLGLIRASHPEPSFTVTAVTTLLAWGVGHRPVGIALVAVTVLTSQLAIGWTNDWIDAERDATVGRTDKPVISGGVSGRLVGLAGLTAALITPLLGLLSGWPATICIAVALIAGLLYNWPLKSTPASVLPYAAAFGALPAYAVLALPGAPAPPAWLVAAGALLGAGAHFANVLPDLQDDARTGIRGLPHRLGAKWSRVAAAWLLLAATLALVFGPSGPPSWPGLAALGAAIVVLPLGWYASHAAAVRRTRSVAAFRAVQLVALIDVVLLVASGRVV